MSDGRRVLCYGPYNRWIQHAAWEMTILHGLRARGADVRHVFCDGLYPECDVFWAATDPRPPLGCVQCQAEVTQTAFRMQAPFEWLGRYVTPAEQREARRWASIVPDDRLMTASYGDWAIGEWVKSSVHSHLRLSELDPASPAVHRAYRAYLEAGFTAATALARLLDDVEPDVLLLFNGRLSSTRVAFELARRRGIRVIVHERGLLPESLNLFENAHCLTLSAARNLWRDWGSTPLGAGEVDRIRAHMDGRAHGRGMSWDPFNPAPQDTDEVRAALRLSAARPLWALFTSSDDEVVADDEWRGPFARHHEWVERTVAWTARHPEIDLVIRVHPNTGGRRSLGRNAAQLAEIQELHGRLPRNARIVMPDDPISTYSLIDIAAVGLVHQSTVGLEMACRGKPVLVANPAHFAGLPFVRTLLSADGYEGMLDELLALGSHTYSADVQRLAYRFAYAFYFRWCVPFPLVKMAENAAVSFAFRSLDDLRPGRSPELDRIARIILEGEPVCPPPGAAARGTSEIEEAAAVAVGAAPVAVTR